MQPVNEAIDPAIFGDAVVLINKFFNPTNKGSGTYLGGSISNYTKNLVMTFPCMVDNSLSASTASMISKANERNIVTMLEMLFSAAQMNGKNGQEVIASIHNNIKTNYNIDDYMDIVGNYVSAFESAGLTDAETAKILKEMVLELKRPAKCFPVESLSESSLMDYEVRNYSGKAVVTEAKKNDKNKPSKYNPNVDAYGNVIPDRTDKYETDADGNMMGNVTTTFTYHGTGSDKTKNYHKHDMSDPNEPTPDDLDYEIQKQRLKQLKKSNKDKSEEWNRAHQMQKDDNELFTRRLLDTDVKKANEMQPSLMIVNYNLLDTDNKIYNRQSFVAGVKSRLISVDPIDIVERIASKNKTKINFANFIRATTGEISFVKDFLLCIKQAKINAKNASKKGLAATMWNTLENRSIKNNWNKIFKKGNDASAITVLVLSQETVNAIAKYHDFDITKWKNANQIMEAYNLMGIIIADESIEVVKFLYAGNDSWETQAYSYLEKEGKDQSYKKVVNLLNKNQI